MVRQPDRLRRLAPLDGTGHNPPADITANFYGSYEDSLVSGVLATATRYGVKVAFHIEPCSGRPAAYINAHHALSPAYHRDPLHGDNGAFYVFQSLNITGADIVLAQTTDLSKLAHFNGLYTYDGIAGQAAGGRSGVGAYALAHGMV